MPQNKYALARYTLIDKLLRKYSFVKTRLIVETCRTTLGYNVTQRTIQMDINAMKNDTFLGYYAPIEYHTQQKAYYYKDSSYQLSPLQLSDKEIKLVRKVFIIVRRELLPEEFSALKHMADKIRITIT